MNCPQARHFVFAFGMRASAAKQLGHVASVRPTSRASGRGGAAVDPDGTASSLSACSNVPRVKAAG